MTGVLALNGTYTAPIHCGIGDRKDVEACGWGGVLQEVVFWTQRRHCVHEFIPAVVTHQGVQGWGGLRGPLAVNGGLGGAVSGHFLQWCGHWARARKSAPMPTQATLIRLTGPQAHKET